MVCINVLFLTVVQKEKKVEMHCPRHSWPISEFFSEFMMSEKYGQSPHITFQNLQQYQSLMHNIGHLPQPKSKYCEPEYSVR